MADYTAQCSSNQYITLLLRTEVVNQDVASNTTTLSWSLHVLKSGASTSATWGNCSYGATINGNAYSDSGQVRVEAGGDTVLLTGTTTVPHNADGTKTVSLSASISGKIVGSLSASETLATIPRASSLSVSGGTMGSPITLTINAASSSFTHSLTYQFGNTSGTILSYVGPGTHKWTPPLSLANQIPTATSGVGTLTLYTWAGQGISIGVTYYSFTLSLPSSIVPSVSSVAASEATSGLSAKFGAYVQGKSTLKVVVSAAGSYGSTIKNCVISFDGKTYSGTSVTTSPPSKSGSQTITAKVTDSRGRTASKSITVTVLPYTNPAISALRVFRCTSDGTADESGDYVGITYAYAIASVNSKNDALAKTEYKRTALTEWAELMTGSDYAVNTTVYPEQELLSDYQWDIRLTVSDYFGSTSMTVTLPSAEVLLDLLSSGQGLAIGKTAELEDTMDVSWAARFLSNVSIKAGLDAQSLTVGSGPSFQGVPKIQYATPAIWFQNASGSHYATLLVNKASGSFMRQNASLAGNYTLLDTGNTADYVVAQGTSGNWRYAKYANGTAWCYCTRYSTGIDISNPWGGVFITPDNSISSIAYPFSFAAGTIPTEVVSTQSAFVGSMWLVNGTVKNTNTKTGTYDLVSGTGGFKDCNISYFVIGRWK